MMERHKSVIEKIQLYSKLSLQRQREGHLPFWRQILEIFGFALVTGNGPGYYLMAGLYRRSIPWREKCQHLSAREFKNRVRKLNPASYTKISQNKLSEKGVLHLLGFPTPRFIGHLRQSSGKSYKATPLQNGKDLIHLIETEDFKRICFKPVEGWGGLGFEAVNVLKKNGTYYFRRLSNGNIETVERFCEEIIDLNPYDGVLIEDYLVQHPTLAAFNPSSVNTCRVWVLDVGQNKPRSVLAYLRIGRKGSLVDNHSLGGLVAPIDLDSGITHSAIDGLPERREYPFHPDHGTPIENQKLPYWDQAKALAESCLASFPRLGFAGLDISVSPTGPAILEMNVEPDREGAAYVDIPSGKVLPP